MTAESQNANSTTDAATNTTNSQKTDQHAEHRALARGAGVIAIFTLISRVAGLIRDLVITHVFGASGITDVFFMAFTIPNVLRRLVAEGSLTTIFTPIYKGVQEKEGKDAASAFFAAMFGLVLTVVLAITVVGIIAAPLIVYLFASGFANDAEKFATTVWLTRSLFPYVYCISIMALFMAVLNANGYFAAPAAAPMFLNIAMISATLILYQYVDPPILAVVIGVLIGGVLQFALQIPTMIKSGLMVKPTMQWNTPHVREFSRLLVPELFGLAVYQLNIIVLRQLGSYLPEGQISYYYTADRLMELVIGIFAVSIAQAALPQMSKQAAAQDLHGLAKTWEFSIKLTNFIAIPAAFGLVAISLPIVSVLFLHGKFDWEDAQMTAKTAMCFAPGLVAIAGIRTSVQVFYALKKPKIPVLVATMTFVVNLILGLLLLRYQVQGLAMTLSLACYFQFVVLLVMLRRELHELPLRSVLYTLLRQAAFAALAGAGASGLSMFGDWQHGHRVVNGLLMFACIGLATIIYGALALWARDPQMHMMTERIGGAVRRRLKKR